MAENLHIPSYLAGWNDAKAGRQYGEGRIAQRPTATTEPKKCPKCQAETVFFFRDDLDECRSCHNIWKVDGSGNPTRGA